MPVAAARLISALTDPLKVADWIGMVRGLLVL
jgi:hypothetical protein